MWWIIFAGRVVSAEEMAEQFTRREVARILGVEEKRLAYWERLRLVKSRARWGERFYYFTDLVALRALQSLAENNVPAQRVRRALHALEARLGAGPLTLSSQRAMAHGRAVVFMTPGPPPTPIEPLSGQLLFAYPPAREKVRAIGGRTAQQWFEAGLQADGRKETLPRAIEAYRHAVRLAPSWPAALINLGAALYQTCALAEARACFEQAVALAPENPTARFNLGCVLEDLDDLSGAIGELEAAVRLDPKHAEAHFNLGLACEKNGQPLRAHAHWVAYLKLQPRSAWSDFARTRLNQQTGTKEPIPFPRKN
jgi:tetratricopeptide (TPR) repeat protein